MVTDSFCTFTINLRNMKFFWLSLVFSFAFIVSSCSSENNNNEITNGVATQFVYRCGEGKEIKDFSIDANQNTFVIERSNQFDNVNKIDFQGNSQVLFAYNNYNSISPKLETVGSNLFYINGQSYPDTKLYKIENNTINPIHTFDNDLLPSPNAIYQIGSFQNKVAFFDESCRKLKAYDISTASETFIAGSGEYTQTDGSGTEASFININKIISKNDAIYLLDNQFKIRKVIPSTAGFTVSTVINHNTAIDDVAIDSDNSVFVLVRFVGLYKFVSGYSDFFPYKTGITTLKTPDNRSSFTLDWSKVSNIKIVNANLYLIYENTQLICIPDFRQQLL